MLKGFREFIGRGNVVDLAVAVVLGTAFTAIVSAIVEGFINPLIAAIFGQPDLASVANFTIRDAQFSIGLVLAAVFNFLCVAAAVYFFIVTPINKLRELQKKEPESEEEATPPEDILLLREIRDALRERV
ncbi:large conductance mechanosensitive channel protein MscL [Jiangella ureilytica]|uniref:Large-conductance mechanosensitive channel n=1 Tax=Jiangella ureilytica TaxID=2530374 RepID=A0A4R4RQ23_9ACTN|nr:large conductance mechanosensitive channel protein MscL [Jiangella ureilytica]TDC51991.1 large conductance mechanosensitive channel protein MscL [Jiangella ureilytica]